MSYCLWHGMSVTCKPYVVHVTCLSHIRHILSHACLSCVLSSVQIVVSSGGMYTVKLDPDDLNFDNLSYMYGNSAYAQNKVGCSHEVCTPCYFNQLCSSEIVFCLQLLSPVKYSCCSFSDWEVFATNRVKVIVFPSSRPLHWCNDSTLCLLCFNGPPFPFSIHVCCLQGFAVFWSYILRSSGFRQEAVVAVFLVLLYAPFPSDTHSRRACGSAVVRLLVPLLENKNQTDQSNMPYSVTVQFSLHLIGQFEFLVSRDGISNLKTTVCHSTALLRNLDFTLHFHSSMAPHFIQAQSRKWERFMPKSWWLNLYHHHWRTH